MELGFSSLTCPCFSATRFVAFARIIVLPAIANRVGVRTALFAEPSLLWLEDKRLLMEMNTKMPTGKTGPKMAALPTDWGDSEMNTFDAAFFKELNKLDALVELDEYNSILMPPLDGFRLRLSQLQKAGKVGDDFAGLTRNFINTLAMRSDGRYLFEEDFRVHPYHIRSFSKGRSGRKQLYVGFDAYPPSDLVTCPWGVSIGLGFDFRDKHGIVTACANEYEAFYERVCCNQELFDATFGSLGSYAEGITDTKEPVTAKTVFETEPGMFQQWAFFGKRLAPDDIAALGSLESFADECIRVFDMICDAGYYDNGRHEAIL